MLLCALATAMALGAGSAQAVVRTVGGATVGLQPREEAFYWVGVAKGNGLGKSEGVANPAVLQFADDPGDLSQPGPVVHSLQSYAVYWDPQDYYHGDWQNVIDRYLANAGDAGGQLDNVFAVDAQYTDRTDVPATSHSSFRGAFTDTNPYPEAENCTDPEPWKFGVPLLQGAAPVCLTDAQIRAQLEAFRAQHSLPTGMGTVFYLLTPPGVTVCLDGGGASGHCSDFHGTVSEIAEYEEARATYAERLTQYQEEKFAYEQEKLELENEGKTDESPPPVKPSLPSPPASYGDYENSFCSYHSDLNPDSSAVGDSSVVLYAVLPWTAGSSGDYDFGKPETNISGDACQDGGFEPGTKPGGESEEKEREKPKTRKEEEEFEKKTPQERREAEEASELGLDRPHGQEPNQLGGTRSPDGFWDEGLADLVINQIAVEQQNTVTDPLLNGWQDPEGHEVTDECRNLFAEVTGGNSTADPLTRAGTLENQALGEGKYYLNDTFNAAALRLPYPAVPCLKGIRLQPKFTAPNPVGAGELVGFDGMESDITLNAAVAYAEDLSSHSNYATYSWNFGDGSPIVTGYAPGGASQNSPSAAPCAAPWLAPCAASAFHSYQYGGVYEVTLTVKDVGGNVASYTSQITVVGPARPTSTSSAGSPTPSSGGAGAAATPSTPGTSGSTAGKAGTAPSVAPTIAESVTSRSLKSAVRRGIPVRYQVNGEVAGRIEVLLSASIAAHLGIKGRTATGLPAGYPRSIVIGSAVLVTTRAGQGTLHVKFLPAVARRLKKTHQLKLTLRFVLRSVSGGVTHTTTALSTVGLSH
ncbi:MAG TPA: PKD domain-containing protein [Solirubrobacteraceae bacterium]|nr:PKD domain-containing protein [Solirubrobacteraceae bacterium]